MRRNKRQDIILRCGSEPVGIIERVVHSGTFDTVMYRGKRCVCFGGRGSQYIWVDAKLDPIEDGDEE